MSKYAVKLVLLEVQQANVDDDPALNVLPGIDGKAVHLKSPTSLQE